ncbi:MAG TPA: hypothetical protein PK819_13345, partial [Thermomicrobiales bacterium]|nr:hypothetical protein [Thermomicrobiales bacterium]
MRASEFALRLKALMEHQQVVFFVGAGCSISSGIPGAGDLVREHWLPRLYDASHHQEDSFDTWVQREFPTYDPTMPAHAYGDVMARLFVDGNQRQMEIERICAGKDPGFGYASLAQLMALPKSQARIVLTTNFDDLVFDALYLYA